MRVKAKANAMENAEVEFISLVSRPATRIPFRALKSEDSQETDQMIHFKNMFKRDGDAALPQGCTLAGIVLQKQHAEHFEPQIAALGLKIDDKVEDDDVVVYRQVEFTNDAVTAIKLSEVGGLFLNAPENVQKQFDPFPEGNDFKDNMAQGGFFPGVHVATDVMLETVRNVLRTAEDGAAAKAGLGQVLESFSTHILAFVDELPSVAFKLDALTREGFEAGEGDADNSQSADGDGSDPAKKADGDEGEASAEGEGEASGTGEAEGAQAKKAEGGELTDEQKLKAKGVHLEGMPAGGEGEPAKKADDKNEASAGEGEPKATEKSDEEKSEQGALAAIAAKMSEVLEAVSGVRKDVGDLKSTQAELTDQVKDAAKKADAATLAVKGTVPLSSDAGDKLPDESLGTHRRNQKADTDGNGVDWGGTSLDRIVGEFGGSR